MLTKEQHKEHERDGNRLAKTLGVLRGEVDDDSSAAAPVTVTEGQTVENFDFTLSPKLTTRTISGIVEMPDGKPAVKASVCLEDVENSEGSVCQNGTMTDAKGHFVFTAMNNIRYLIRSHITAPAAQQRHAEPFETPAKGDVKNVKLVITEANGSCEKCRLWKRTKN